MGSTGPGHRPREQGTRPPLGFAVHDLLRHTSEAGEGLLEEHRADPTALTVVLADVGVLLDGASALHGLALLDGVEPMAQVLLGTRAGTPILATGLDPVALQRLAAHGDRAVADLRMLATAGQVPQTQVGYLAQARSLLAWHATHPFCSRCGAATRLSCAGSRRDCDGCGARHFPRTDPVVIMRVSAGDAVLLGRQRRYPPGTYSCLAGFVEPGETIEAAVARETFEEAGVRVGSVRYVLSQPWPFTSQLMIGCAAEAAHRALDVDLDELEDARWFERDEVHAMLEGRHPDGLVVPPPVAVAHHLIHAFARG
jgi:NAD+ diphosphatase